MLVLALLTALRAFAAPASLDDSARALAGLPVAESSPLAPLMKNAAWKQSKATLDKQWTDYATDDLQPIKDWAGKEMSGLPSHTMFYPFSGPDILNAVAFYPQGDDYILMGLERIGALPSYEPAAPGAVVRDMELTRVAMGWVLRLGYFITMQMSEQVGNSPTTGVAGMLSWFLVRTDHELLSGRLVAFDKEGAMVTADGKKVVPTGVEIVFRKRGETKEHRVWYFRGDVQDSQLATVRKPIVDFVTSKGEVVTFLKAASYLMFNKSFDDMRSLILARSVAVVSDDSGMPWHFVSRGGWETRLYGAYHKPIPDFAGRCQPELEKAVTAGSRGPIPFDFGYTWYKPHMVMAVRNADNPVGTPTFDKNSNLGLGVSCYGGKTVVR
jgi:hypothetical protein